MPEREVGSQKPGEKGDEGEDATAGGFVDTWLMPYVRDSSLWSILFIFLVHIVLFIAAALLWSARDQNFAAVGALLLLAWLSSECVRSDFRKHRRPAAMSAVIVAVWALSVGVAMLGDYYGLL